MAEGEAAGGEQLFDAVAKGEARRVASILTADPMLARLRRPGGASPILLAIYHGHPNLVPLFLDAGAALDFHEACAYGDSDRVRGLLESELSLLEERGSEGHAPLGLAILFGHDAIARRNPAMVRDLLARGAEPNAEQADAVTPLHEAAFHGDREIPDWPAGKA